MQAEDYYKVDPISWGWTETSKGQETFGMNFVIRGKADPNRPDAPLIPCEPGTGRWSITPSTDKAADWLVRTVRALGYDRGDLLGLDPDCPEAFNFEGREFIVQCRHKEYLGQVREEWTVVTPRPKLANDKLGKLNERLATKFAEAKKPAVATPIKQVATPADPKALKY